MDIRETLKAEYLDWVNNYLTPAVFGEHRGLTEDQAHQLINLGRAVFESKHIDE
jgi:ADP-ribosylglycohydrolase